MTTKKGTRKYTQKTIQTTSAPSASISAEVSNMADTVQVAEQRVEDSSLTVRILQSELKTLREGISADLIIQVENMKEELQKEIAQLRRESKAETAALGAELSQQIQTLCGMHTETRKTQREMEKKSLNDNSDKMTAMEKSYETLSKEYKKVWEKCLDLENRSRRQNLRFVGVTEGAEGGDVSRFLAHLLQQVLGADNFESPPLIDRAHRTGTPQNRRDGRPCALLARMHYYADKEKILRLSREKGGLSYNEVSRLRTSFNQVKAKLRAVGVPYSLYYPARLTINVKGSTHVFTEPDTFIRPDNIESMGEA
uniref:L1 transposable element RRM domain-containing protein n=1 Tax=Periophthalmus magnuspinnatus TaxID=409849 RepID=A0A3B3ZST6_9GOBI